jgi:hypothetical protein
MKEASKGDQTKRDPDRSRGLAVSAGYLALNTDPPGTKRV